MFISRNGIIRNLLLILFFLLPIFTVLEVLSVSALAIIFSILIFILIDKKLFFLSIKQNISIVLLFSLFFFYALLSYYWSFDSIETIKGTLHQLIPLGFVGISMLSWNKVLDKESINRIFKFFSWGFFIAIVIVLIDLIYIHSFGKGPSLSTGHTLIRYSLFKLIYPNVVQIGGIFNMNAVVLAIIPMFFVWGAYNHIVGRIKLNNFCIIWIFLLGFSFLSRAVAPFATLFIGGIAFFILNFIPQKIAYRIVKVIMVLVAALTVPIVIFLYSDTILPHLNFLKQSGDNIRLDIWNATVALIRQNPWFGHGFDMAKKIPYAMTSRISGVPIQNFLHPHEMILLILEDLGIFGLILAVLFGFSLVNKMGKYLDRRVFNWSMALFFGVMFNYLVNFSLWRSWWMFLLFLSFFLISLLNKLKLQNE